MIKFLFLYTILKLKIFSKSSILNFTGFKSSLPQNSSLIVNYSKDCKEPIKLSKPQVPANISPWFITGYSDAEACFDFNILKSKSIKIGFSVISRFRITAHKRDIVLLYMIKEYFNCGQ
jgi:hypothetical protein